MNSLAVLQQLKSLALMEFIPTKQITDEISGWLRLDAQDDSNIVNNFGVMLVIGLAIVLVVLALITTSILVSQSYPAYRMYQRIRSRIYYNTFLRYQI